jgi:hypothetical protein
VDLFIGDIFLIVISCVILLKTFSDYSKKNSSSASSLSSKK